jgi:hypothetical protein
MYVHNNLNNIRRALALGAAGVALTASPALAQPDYPVVHVAPNAAAPAGRTIDLRTPDAKDASRVPAPATSSPATSSLAGTTSASPQAGSTAGAAKADDGVNWGSIGIGAGAVAAITLIGLGGVAVTHRARVHPAR